MKAISGRRILSFVWRRHDTNVKKETTQYKQLDPPGAIGFTVYIPISWFLDQQEPSGTDGLLVYTYR